MEKLYKCCQNCKEFSLLAAYVTIFTLLCAKRSNNLFKLSCFHFLIYSLSFPLTYYFLKVSNYLFQGSQRTYSTDFPDFSRNFIEKCIFYFQNICVKTQSFFQKPILAGWLIQQWVVIRDKSFSSQTGLWENRGESKQIKYKTLYNHFP